MIGEVWEDASNKVAYGTPREYLSGNEMDSAMNYPLRTIWFDFLTGALDGRQTARRLASQIENYPRENLYAMMNLISSHDVQRAITVLAGVPYYEGDAGDRAVARTHDAGAVRARLAPPSHGDALADDLSRRAQCLLR